ncbi:hypothetical protein AKN92_07355 [Thiopseudomonas alkaliphila]|nr:hypothetical protein AKN92_07355 [Thiopseudomonas alkaliphila]
MILLIIVYSSMTQSVFYLLDSKRLAAYHHFECKQVLLYLLSLEIKTPVLQLFVRSFMPLVLLSLSAH